MSKLEHGLRSHSKYFSMVQHWLKLIISNFTMLNYTFQIVNLPTHMYQVKFSTRVVINSVEYL